MPDYLTLFAVVAGAISGTLIGIAGGVGGDLARQGKPPSLWIARMFVAVMIIGIVTVLVGIWGLAFHANGGVATIIGCIIIAVAYYTNWGAKSLPLTAKREPERENSDIP
jgi:uncharacterized membrane protein YfcA